MVCTGDPICTISRVPSCAHNAEVASMKVRLPPAQSSDVPEPCWSQTPGKRAKSHRWNLQVAASAHCLHAAAWRARLSCSCRWPRHLRNALGCQRAAHSLLQVALQRQGDCCSGQ